MRLSDRLKKRRNRAIALGFCVLVFLALAKFAAGGEADQAFFNGNRLYEQGDYKAAAAEYNKVLDMGLESGNLYYNLGNAYIKMDKVAAAILSYRRALELIPRDGDLESNLRYAELSIKDKLSLTRANLFMRLLDNFSSSMTVNEFAILSSAVFILFWVAAIAALLLRGVREKLAKVAAVVLVVFVLSAAASAYKIYGELFHKEGVIMQPRVGVRYSPTEDGTVAFNLHRGSTVRLIRRRNGWVQVGVPGGKSGWIGSGAIQAVNKILFDKNKYPLKVTIMKEKVVTPVKAESK